MEAILGIIGFFIVYVVAMKILGAAGRTVKVVGKSAFGKGTLKENMELEFKGMGSMQVRVQEDRLDSGQVFLTVQCKGVFPLNLTTKVGFMVSVLSNDDEGRLAPVISNLDGFQESNSTAFQCLNEVGEVSGSQGYIDWVQIGAVPLEILQPALGGKNELNIVTRLVDMDNIPEIYLGFGDGDLWSSSQVYEYRYASKGYREEAENRDKARALSIEIGMAIAMSDGELDDTEGETLKSWIQKMITPYSDEKQKELKRTYNEAMKVSYQLAESGNLVLSDICSKLNEIGEDAQKYEALELAHKVMAADGIIHKEEMKVIHQVADALGIDSEELEKMRDQQIVGLNTTTEDVDVESLLGIDSSWDNVTTSTHLRKEYQKWNNRLNTLQEGGEEITPNRCWI